MFSRDCQETSRYDADGALRASDSGFTQLSENSIAVAQPTNFKSSDDYSVGSQPGSLTTLPEFQAVQDNQPAPKSYNNALKDQEPTRPRDSDQVVRLKAELTKLQFDFNAKEDEVVVLRTALNMTENEKAALKNEKAGLENEKAALENELNMATIKLEHCRDKICELTEELSAAKQHRPHGNASDSLSPKLQRRTRRTT